MKKKNAMRITPKATWYEKVILKPNLVRQMLIIYLNNYSEGCLTCKG